MSSTNLNEEFASEVVKPELEIDLGRAALLLATLEYPKLDISSYLKRLDQIASTIKSRLDSDDTRIVASVINRHLFEELEFRGNRSSYYDPKNSFLNEVLERRIGIPITLSVLYIEVALRVGLTVQGVGMPGHFLVKFDSADGSVIIDPFNSGRQLSVADCEQILAGVYGEGTKLQPEHLRAVAKREILTRMLVNLKNIYVGSDDPNRAIAVIEKLLVINPSSMVDIRDRGLINFKIGKYSAAIRDFELVLEKGSSGAEAEIVKKYLGQSRAQLAKLN
ncbi:MAG: transglutaminase family protein [Blastocatellia bacterium]|nr:transglutaminase family protein [Blastocatellia bacterium]